MLKVKFEGEARKAEGLQRKSEGGKKGGRGRKVSTFSSKPIYGLDARKQMATEAKVSEHKIGQARAILHAAGLPGT
jgi:hypothetical protein